MAIYLVRHAQPAIDPGQSPGQWPLSPAGREAASSLRETLPHNAAWICSPEVKAVQTLQLAQNQPGPITVDERLSEVARPSERFDPNSARVKQARRDWVRGQCDERHVGWETPERAASRFAACIADHDGGGDIVVGTHGMVLTAWLVHGRRSLGVDQASQFWASLSLPQVIMLDQSATSSTSKP